MQICIYAFMSVHTHMQCLFPSSFHREALGTVIFYNNEHITIPFSKKKKLGQVEYRMSMEHLVTWKDNIRTKGELG